MLNGKAIKKRREKLGLTLATAAKRAGMSQFQTWYRLEAGVRKSVSLATAVAVAKVLRCKVDDLLQKRPAR